jgi:hypothetical protein
MDLLVRSHVSKIPVISLNICFDDCLFILGRGCDARQHITDDYSKYACFSCFAYSHNGFSRDSKTQRPDLHRVLCGDLSGMQTNGTHREWDQEKVFQLYEGGAGEFP